MNDFRSLGQAATTPGLPVHFSKTLEVQGQYGLNRGGGTPGTGHTPLPAHVLNLWFPVPGADWGAEETGCGASLVASGDLCSALHRGGLKTLGL